MATFTPAARTSAMAASKPSGTSDHKLCSTWRTHARDTTSASATSGTPARASMVATVRPQPAAPGRDLSFHAGSRIADEG